MADKICLAERFVQSFQEISQSGVGSLCAIEAVCKDYKDYLIGPRGCFDDVIFSDGSCAVLTDDGFTVK